MAVMVQGGSRWVPTIQNKTTNEVGPALIREWA